VLLAAGFSFDPIGPVAFLVALAITGLFLPVVLLGLPRWWAHSSNTWDRPRSWWPWSDAAWTAYVRALGMAALGALCVGLGDLLLFLGLDFQNQVWLVTFGVLCLALVAVFLVGALLAFVFAWPRQLLPPWLRTRPSLVREAWNRVRPSDVKPKTD
jgi:hypothetical protein